MLSLPPSSPGPAATFRAVVRGSLPLTYRVPAAPHIPLHVRAPAAPLAADALASDQPQALLLPAVLRTPEGPAFTCWEDAGAMLAEDMAELWSEVWKALQVCAPVAHRKQWYEVLRKGAEENPTIAVPMSRCIEFGFVASTPRPDLYYGKPVCELSDGQYLAWRVCADEFLRSIK